MPPLSSEPPVEFKSSFPHIKYPTLRDHPEKSPDSWIAGKRIDDNAEGLWRIHNKLYDLSSFLDKHPGGKEWLILTKGTDITEAFESHHVTETAPSLLPKFYTRDAVGPRNSPYTFDDNGFYRTLKRRVAPVLPEIKQKRTNLSAIYADSVMASAFFFSILTAMYQSYLIAILAAICMTWVIIIAHNFFHMKDNFRMYYFNIGFLSYREWRISHVLSHHLHTNTLQDYEMSTFEPFFQWLPKPKSMFVRFVPWLYAVVAYCLVFLAQILRRIYRTAIGKRGLAIDDLFGLILPAAMYILSGQSLSTIVYWWFVLIFMSSFHFSLVGLNAAHHHPHIFHDGDAVREERDWGLLQLDAVVDRPDINGNKFLVLTNFGDHALHHLFPTLDHEILPELLPVVEETCREFNVELRFISQFQLFVGQFLQLARTKPSTKPVSAFYKKKN